MPTTLRFTLTSPSTGKPVTNLALEHEKLMHLVIVSRDLTYFAHVHPDSTGKPGEFAIAHIFPAQGDYVLYDEFAQTNGEDETHRFDLKVGGANSPPAQLTPNIAPAEADGYKVWLTPSSPTRAGEQSTFVLEVTRDGKPVTDLQPYLAAAAHIVILDQKADGFQHTHAWPGQTPPKDEMAAMAALPANFGSDSVFIASFDKPGLYKIWAQFSHQGQIITVSWVVPVN
jgi:Cu+-exporting ATPase